MDIGIKSLIQWLKLKPLIFHNNYYSHLIHHIYIYIYESRSVDTKSQLSILFDQRVLIVSKLTHPSSPVYHHVFNKLKNLILVIGFIDSPHISQSYHCSYPAPLNFSVRQSTYIIIFLSCLCFQLFVSLQLNGNTISFRFIYANGQELKKQHPIYHTQLQFHEPIRNCNLYTKINHNRF